MSIVETYMNKIAVWISVHVDNWAAESRAIVASSDFI